MHRPTSSSAAAATLKRPTGDALNPRLRRAGAALEALAEADAELRAAVADARTARRDLGGDRSGAGDDAPVGLAALHAEAAGLDRCCQGLFIGGPAHADGNATGGGWDPGEQFQQSDFERADLNNKLADADYDYYQLDCVDSPDAPCPKVADTKSIPMDHVAQSEDGSAAGSGDRLGHAA
jgi:hypothetical protein